MRTLCCSLLLTLSLVLPAQATNEMQEKMATLAETILKNTKQQAVKVGQFSPTGLDDSNSGPGIEGLLTSALQNIAANSVRKDAKFEIKGDYGLVLNRSTNLKEVKITARLIELETGEELKELRVQASLNGTNTIAKVLQVTAALPPKGSKEERNEELIKQAKGEKSVHIHGAKQTQISSTSASPYAVEILVKPHQGHDTQPAQPRAASNEKGLAFVDIKRDELYEVKIYNNSAAPVAVALSVDGLDMFHFSKDRASDGRPTFTHLIIPARTTDTIVGWHNSLAGSQNYLSFLVTDYGQGAVSQAGIKARGQVGVIHVQFSNCHPLPENAHPRSGNETGFGPPREVKQKIVQFEIEPPHDFVSVRYTR